MFIPISFTKGLFTAIAGSGGARTGVEIKAKQDHLYILTQVMLPPAHSRYLCIVMVGNLTPEEINEVLAANMNGRIGYTDGDKIYIMPVNYAFNGNHLILHSREGGKIDKLREHPHVCFEVEEVHDQSHWKTVLTWGDYEEITDEKEKYYAMKFLVSRLIHMKVSETMALEGVPKPVIYRIRIRESTGRFEKA